MASPRSSRARTAAKAAARHPADNHQPAAAPHRAAQPPKVGAVSAAAGCGEGPRPAASGHKRAREEPGDACASAHGCTDHGLTEEDFTCAICWDLLLDPVVASCGHDFCQLCYHRWTVDQGKRSCPTCRAQLAADAPGVCRRMQEALEALFPERMTQRAAEAAEHRAALKKARAEAAARQSAAMRQHDALMQTVLEQIFGATAPITIQFAPPAPAAAPQPSQQPRSLQQLFLAQQQQQHQQQQHAPPVAAATAERQLPSSFELPLGSPFFAADTRRPGTPRPDLPSSTRDRQSDMSRDASSDLEELLSSLVEPQPRRLNLLELMQHQGLAALSQQQALPPQQQQRGTPVPLQQQQQQQPVSAQGAAHAAAQRAVQGRTLGISATPARPIPRMARVVIAPGGPLEGLLGGSSPSMQQQQMQPAVTLAAQQEQHGGPDEARVAELTEALLAIQASHSPAPSMQLQQLQQQQQDLLQGHRDSLSAMFRSHAAFLSWQQRAMSAIAGDAQLQANNGMWATAPPLDSMHFNMGWHSPPARRRRQHRPMRSSDAP